MTEVDKQIIETTLKNGKNIKFSGTPRRRGGGGVGPLAKVITKNLTE